MHRLGQLIDRLERGLLALMLSAMIGLGLGQILLRNIWSSGIDWADPLLRLLVLWIAMLGAMQATHQDRHIRIDLLSRYLPSGLKPWQSRLSNLAAGLICLPLAWHAGRFVILEYQDGTRLFSGFPAWVAELALPLGFALMALRMLLNAFSPSPKNHGEDRPPHDQESTC